MGQAASFMGDSGAAKAAASNIFKTIDRKPPIDSSSTEGETKMIKGKISAQNLHFSFPMRMFYVLT